MHDGADRTARFREARTDPALAVLEGFHALKHALRFGATVDEVAVRSGHDVDELARDLAPELTSRIATLAERVGDEVWSALAPRPPATGVMAIARRPAIDVAALLADSGPAPVVLLEDPRTMANMGACVRVAAAAGAAGVLTTGASDPWHPSALRGAAGLHFALPVGRATGHEPSDRPLVAVDPDGSGLGLEAIPRRATIAFGTERHGLTDALLQRADVRVRIPMRDGVSSLNLATAVAAVLYGAPAPRRP